ncbi:MAG: hypothetical protein HYZ01_05920 [Ignavibacteriales bacterium]|nr:hypothetical protein [Ignavibacteriales bacterium]
MQRYLRVVLFLLAVSAVVPAQEIDWKKYDPKTARPEEVERVNRWIEGNLNRQLTSLSKRAGDPREIRSMIMRGNKITTIVYNYGNITRPSLQPPNTLNLVWNRLGYGFEFTPLVAGEVIENGDTIRILNDGMWLVNQGGYAPDGSLKWGWLPKAGLAAPGQADIAAWSHRSDVGGDLTRRPHSWPESWYNPLAGRYVWPAFLGDDATTPDEEVYFVVDDYTNAKYPYYPFPGDSTKRGLGLDMEVRFFQFNNPLAEDIIFLVYRVTNRSAKTINRVWFGMYGDPHIGGQGDFADDLAFFIPPRGPLADPYPQRTRSMVYAWDDNGRGDGGLIPGYFGFKFLESPTNSSDGIDNDDDGVIDESPFNDAGFYIDGVDIPLNTGIADVVKYTARYGPPKPRWSGDENGNWDPEKHDSGLDGIPGTGDFGEGNGRPDIGYDDAGNLVAEPNFGIRDPAESDQIGLTSFFALPYTNSLPNVPKNDVLFFEFLSTDSIRIDQELFGTPGDNIFVYGSGPFSLAPGETQRFSVALLLGHDLQDLLLNGETAQRVLEAGYRFAQPPPKPNVTVVPGDRRVTLYWDTAAERAIDPLTGVNDFEGYKIYRSEDPTFSDIYTVTDANGNPFLGRPFTQNGVPAQFDLVNQWSGLHPVEFEGRGVKYNVGNNSGLVHTYVDSSVTNGKTYFYAVVSYDHGYDSLGIRLPPTESQAIILQDPITGELAFDANTAGVTPGPLPSGYSRASIVGGGKANRVAGRSTGTVMVKVLDDLSVRDGETYLVDFEPRAGGVRYNVRPNSRYRERIVGRDSGFVSLAKKNIIADSVVVRRTSGAVVNPDTYFVDGESGRIRGFGPGGLPAGEEFEVEYPYYAVFNSVRTNNQDDNPVFDGLRVFAADEPLGIDSLRSGWIMANNTNLTARVHRPVSLIQLFTPVPYDFEIRWNSTDTTADGKWAQPGDTLLTNVTGRVAVCPFRIVNVTNGSPFRGFVNGASSDQMWRPGREIVLLTPVNPIRTYMSITFSAPPSTPAVLPAAGNVYVARTTKPFEAGDRYEFRTDAAKYATETARSALEEIYVVPNPYVAFSGLERPQVSATRRGDQRLQFRNLPPQCTIRIYTIMGELVDTIEKDDFNSYADWPLLTYEGHRLAYGVYIYHVDVPEVGQKIGRFAVIK